MQRKLAWAALGVVLLILFLPMRLALDWSGLPERGLSAGSVRGSIWSARIQDLNFGKLALGPMRAGLKPLPLLTGTTALQLDRVTTGGTLPPLSLRLESYRSGAAISDATGEIIAQGLFAPLPVQRIMLDRLTVRFADGQCKIANGTIRVDLEQSLFGLTIRQGMSGNVRCDDGAVLLPLRGQSGLDGLDLRITSDGRYSGQLRLGGLDSALIASFGQMGFTVNGDSISLPISGRF